jgi:hypothetical protein
MTGQSGLILATRLPAVERTAVIRSCFFTCLAVQPDERHEPSSGIRNERGNLPRHRQKLRLAKGNTRQLSGFTDFDMTFYVVILGIMS